MPLIIGYKFAKAALMFSVSVRSEMSTGRYWWVLTGLNRRHSPCKGDAQVKGEVSEALALPCGAQLTGGSKHPCFSVASCAENPLTQGTAA
jgi:hypothetical protein